MKFVKIRCPYNEYLMSEIIIPVVCAATGSFAWLVCSGEAEEAAIGHSTPVPSLSLRLVGNTTTMIIDPFIQTAPKCAKAISSAMSKALMLERAPGISERLTSSAPISQRSSLSGHRQGMLGRLQWSIELGSNWIGASPRATVKSLSVCNGGRLRFYARHHFALPLMVSYTLRNPAAKK